VDISLGNLGGTGWLELSVVLMEHSFEGPIFPITIEKYNTKTLTINEYFLVAIGCCFVNLRLAVMQMTALQTYTQ